MKSGVQVENMVDNVVDFNLAKQGLIGGPGSDENWLKALVPGTMFLCKRKNTKEMLALEQYWIADHRERASNVVQVIPNGQRANLWVDSLEFSRYYKFVETLAVIEYNFDPELAQEQEKQEEAQDDGSSARPV